MTLVEIQNQIVTQFMKADTFSIPVDLKYIKVSKNQESIKEDIVRTVCLNLCEKGLCEVIISLDDKVSFVLTSPLGSEGQDIQISLYTAELLSQIINQYREALGQSEGFVDKLNITEVDIQNLCVICAQLLNNQDGAQDADGE